MAPNVNRQSGKLQRKPFTDQRRQYSHSLNMASDPNQGNSSRKRKDSPQNGDLNSRAAKASCPFKPSSSTVQPPEEVEGKGLYYHDYLNLDKILDAQHPESLKKSGKLAHDEMLFITIHQAYELWFKLILHEIGSCCQLLDTDAVAEATMGIICRRLERVTRIQAVLVEQMGILETMTPLDFLDFRDYLSPASGFQSVQFRILENKLGLRKENRLHYQKAEYCTALSPEHQQIVKQHEKEPSLFDLVEQWLERTPFLEDKDYDFWESYKRCASAMFDADTNHVRTPADEVKHLASKTEFMALFDEAEYDKLRKAGKKRLSYRAVKAAILISAYRDEPIFQSPFRLITELLNIDGLLTQWRERHAQIVHRVLGMKIGTGGSSGYLYLKAAANRHKIFSDFANLSMYLIPRSKMPSLPDSIVNRLQFHYK